MTIKTLNPDSVPAPVGPYSQAILTTAPGQWLHIAGQVGITTQGELANDFQTQTEQTWENICAILAEAGMGTEHLVKVVTYLVDEQHIPLLGPIRLKYLGDARPAATLIVAAALARPDWKIEIEAVAFKANL